MILLSYVFSLFIFVTLAEGLSILQIFSTNDLCFIDIPHHFTVFNVIDFCSYFYSSFPSVRFVFILLLDFQVLQVTPEINDLKLFPISSVCMIVLCVNFFFCFLFLSSCILLSLNFSFKVHSDLVIVFLNGSLFIYSFWGLGSLQIDDR